MSLIITYKITYNITMFELHNHPLIEGIIIQLNKAIKKWMTKKCVEDRVFKFSFGTEGSWCIARIGIPLEAIDYIVKTRLDNYDIRDYTYDVINEDRILTLYFHN